MAVGGILSPDLLVKAQEYGRYGDHLGYCDKYDQSGTMNIRFVEYLNEYFVKDGHNHFVEVYEAFSFSAYFLVHQLQQAEIVLVNLTALILEFEALCSYEKLRMLVQAKRT